MRYDDLINKKMMTRSVAELLFDEKQRVKSFRSASYPSFALNIGLLYTVFVQAYVIARSIKKGEAVSSEGYPSMFLDNIKETWQFADGKGLSVRDGKLWIFSFLIHCANAGVDELFEKNAAQAISVAKNAILEANKNARKFSALLSEEEFEKYVKALPLLRTTEIDLEKMRFVFHTDGTEENAYTIDCQPFLYFWDNRKNVRSQTPTADCYIIMSLRKGKQLGELCVNLMPLNSKDSEIKIKQIYWQASKNETVRMIFKSLEIPTDWLSIEECWCDLAFMQRLANVAEIVLPKYWMIGASALKKVDIKDRFSKLFNDAAIRASLFSGKRMNSGFLVNQIDNVLFGLFINFGIFRTMRDIFDDSDCPNEKNAQRLFCLFIDAFADKKYIKPEEKQVYIDECNRQIDEHISALKTKVPYEESPQFIRRSCEIKAEWRAYTVLKAAGIRADNLFADKESIYSIDDYYNMVQNTKTSVEDDLKQVLGLLIEIYGALLENKSQSDSELGSAGMRIDEDKYYSDMQRIRNEIKDYGLEKRFDRFEDIVKRSENNETVEGILGRDRICEAENVYNFKTDIFAAMNREKRKDPASKSSDNSVDLSKRFIFVSYSHKDVDKVKLFVDHWKALGFEVYIDSERFHRGMSWTPTALRAIRNENCALVTVFMSENSVISDAVHTELACAQEVAEKRFKDDPEMKERFIHPVNLDEKRDIKQIVLQTKLHDSNNAHISTATDIGGIITGVSIYSSMKDLGTGKLDAEIREMIDYKPAGSEAMRDSNYTELERQVVNFYTFLKYGDGCNWTIKEIDAYFQGNEEYITPAAQENEEYTASITHCIYPIVASMKETKIHRDNITMVGYEMVNGAGEKGDRTNYILTSKPLMSPDDYYCIPHEARVGEDCTWMVDPLLISYKRMMGK